MSVEDAFREALKKNLGSDTTRVIKGVMRERYLEREARRREKDGADQELRVQKPFSDIFSRFVFFLKLFKRS